MNNQKVLSIQDISCFGQCSTTVALPILSSCGIETAILPTAILSTHTGGFKNFNFLDLTDNVNKTIDHWQSENIKFNAIYSGYLGSKKQVDIVIKTYDCLLEKTGLKIVDPAFGDNGKLYTGFDLEYVEEIRKLVAISDICLPNLTEICYLTGNEYKENYDEQYIKLLVEQLASYGAKSIVLTGVSYDEKSTGVVVYSDGIFNYYKHKKFSKGAHGTGDGYASAFTGALLNGYSLIESSEIAADFVVECIEKTIDDPSHWYGAKFELAIPYLVKRLGK